MSNVGKWAQWYDGKTEPIPYGDTPTYQIAAMFLSGIAVEDWGCGYAWFKGVHNGPYWGVDGTRTPFCDEHDDLAKRRSQTPSVLLRHVLEHNAEWRDILANALASAEQRIVIIVFTPDGKGEPCGYTEGLDIYDYAIPHVAIDDALRDAGFTISERMVLHTPTQYGIETVWLAQRE